MKEFEYELNIGHAFASGTVFVNDNASDSEIALSILNDLYDYKFKEIKNELLEEKNEFER